MKPTKKTKSKVEPTPEEIITERIRAICAEVEGGEPNKRLYNTCLLAIVGRIDASKSAFIRYSNDLQRWVSGNTSNPNEYELAVRLRAYMAALLTDAEVLRYIYKVNQQ